MVAKYIINNISEDYGNNSNYSLSSGGGPDTVVPTTSDSLTGDVNSPAGLLQTSTARTVNSLLLNGSYPGTFKAKEDYICSRSANPSPYGFEQNAGIAIFEKLLKVNTIKQDGGTLTLSDWLEVTGVFPGIIELPSGAEIPKLRYNSTSASGVRYTNPLTVLEEISYLNLVYPGSQAVDLTFLGHTIYTEALNAGGTSSTGTGYLVIASDQDVAVNTGVSGGKMQRFNIKLPSGRTVNFNGDIEIPKWGVKVDPTNLGTINFNGNWVTLKYTPTDMDMNGVALDRLRLDHAGTYSGTGTQFVNLELELKSFNVVNGTISCGGTVRSIRQTQSSSTGLIIMSGSADANLEAGGSFGVYPKLTFAKTGDAIVTVKDEHHVRGSILDTSEKTTFIDFVTNQSKVKSVGTSGTVNVRNAFYNFEFSSPGSMTVVRMVVKNQLTLTTTNVLIGGTIFIGKRLTLTDATYTSGSTTKLVMVGRNETEIVATAPVTARVPTAQHTIKQKSAGCKFTSNVTVSNSSSGSPSIVIPVQAYLDPNGFTINGEANYTVNGAIGPGALTTTGTVTKSRWGKVGQPLNEQKIVRAMDRFSAKDRFQPNLYVPHRSA